MGDLTDVGRIDGYRSCAAFIAGALQLGSKGLFANIPVGIVPGNHDINRDLAAEPGFAAKFAPLSQHLSDVGLPPMPVSKTLWSSVGASPNTVDIALLNSCWGCGAKEYIPSEFRDDVSGAIDAALTRAGSGADAERRIRAYYDRQFDTPAFSDASITEFANRASAINQSHVIIACAHHNLLPQRLTRLAPYTELLNSGTLRGTLQSLGRPIIYLHGHIHDDPIELVSAPDGNQLICISAPEAAAGFNVLELVFTRAGMPLSCHVRKWRFDASEIFRVTETVVIPLIGRRARGGDRSLSLLYAHLLTSGEIYWNDLLTFAGSLYTASPSSQLEEALELLAADGRVKIENYAHEPPNWIVGARV